VIAPLTLQIRRFPQRWRFEPARFKPNSSNVQYTPLTRRRTPTRLNSTCPVESRRRRRCEFHLAHDGFDRTIENWTCWEFIQSSWQQNRRLGHDCGWVHTAWHNFTELGSTCSVFSFSTKSVGTRRDSWTTGSCEFSTHRRRRRCVLGLKLRPTGRFMIGDDVLFEIL